MSIEKRVLPGMGGGCRERARAGGAAWGLPAVSPELSVALLMESSREAKGRGGGGGSWSWDSGLNHFEGAPGTWSFKGGL